MEDQDFVFKEILPKLPSKSLFRFKTVSKTWLARISNDATFIADHIDHHSPISSADLCGVTQADYSHEGSFAAQPRRLFFVGRHGAILSEIDMSYIKTKFHTLSLFGSCNGLLCIGLRYNHGNHPGDVVVWNPLTRDFKSFPEQLTPTPTPTPRKSILVVRVHYHFGSDKENSDDYKVVRLEETLRRHPKKTSVDAQILSARRGSCHWRQLRGFSGFKFSGLYGQGLIVDGKMHWAIIFDSGGHQGRTFDFLTFDLSSEEFGVVVGPVRLDDEYYNILGMAEWKGCLVGVSVSRYWEQWHLYRFSAANGWTVTNIFVDIPEHPSMKFFKIIGDKLFLVTSNEKHKYYVYDLNTHQTTALENGLSSVWTRGFFAHTHTLLSPNN